MCMDIFGNKLLTYLLLTYLNGIVTYLQPITFIL